MTDASDGKEIKQPPKIKLGLADTKPAPGASPAKPSTEKDDAPQPKIKLGLGSVTKAIDEAQAAESKDDSVPAKETPKADAPEKDVADQSTPEEKSSEKPKIKLNLDQAEAKPEEEAEKEAPKAEEKQVEEPEQPAAESKPEAEEKPKIKLGLGQNDAPKAEQAEEKPKIKLNLDQAEAKPEEEAKKEAPKAKEKQVEKPAQPAAEEESAEESEAAKGRTMQIADIEGESLDDLYKAALNATQRVILDEKERAADAGTAESETQALKKAEMAESTKKSTARLDLQDMLSDEDRKEMLKDETMHINVDGEAEPQKPKGTLKISRTADAEPPARSDSTMPISLDTEESKKSETARIELPREVASSSGPSSQRKTIRIKRPDGTGAAPRSLSVARKAEPVSDVGGADSEAVTKASTLTLDHEEESVHPAFGAVALVAVLVGVLLLYVLVATLTSALPFPGRLVG